MDVKNRMPSVGLHANLLVGRPDVLNKVRVGKGSWDAGTGVQNDNVLKRIIGLRRDVSRWSITLGGLSVNVGGVIDNRVGHHVKELEVLPSNAAALAARSATPAICARGGDV